MKICPKCKSKNIMLNLGGQTGKYECKNCGYIGSLIIEKDGEIESKMKKELKKLKKEIK